MKLHKKIVNIFDFTNAKVMKAHFLRTMFSQQIRVKIAQFVKIFAYLFDGASKSTKLKPNSHDQQIILRKLVF